MSHLNLGLIPSWQFSQNAETNPRLTPFVKYPEGVYQTTTQPVGPYYASNMSGHFMTLGGAKTLAAEPVEQINTVFDSFWWRHRKVIVVGGLTALALGVIGGVAALLK
jgi:hypothetical protein